MTAKANFCPNCGIKLK
ncbi:MAG: hypothetical protein ACOX8P_08275 [Tepidanaerobacteraceae bacterium]